MSFAKRSHLFLVATLLLAGLSCAVAGRAQTTATISGTVVDSSGAVVPNAAITVTHTETGVARQVQSNDRGLYVVPSLAVGSYSIAAEAAGFKRKVITGIVLQVNQEARIDLALEVGAVSETLTVKAEALLVQSEASSVGTVIDNLYNKEIPLNGRDFAQLILLAPGANDSRSNGATDPSVGSGVSISGRDNLNNFMFDGASNNARQYGNIAIRPSIDAIQEFKVQSNMYSAEFGQAAFAQINLISKQGTNAFHGSAFEFVRNDNLDARNFFLAKVPKLNRNQFGASVGGPIWKNHTFFFANYEGMRERRGVSSYRTVPVDAWRNGDFSGQPALKDPLTGQPFANNRIPTGRFSKPAQVAMGLWAKPNAGAGLINNLLITTPASIDDNQMTVRIDHEISTNDRLTGRYSLFRRLQSATPDLPGFESINPPHSQSFVLTETHVFNPRLLGEYKFSFTRSIYARHSPNAGKDGYFEQFGINHQLIGKQFEGAPRFDFQRISMSSFGDDVWTPLNDISNEFTHAGLVTWTRGQHTMKMGFSITNYQQNTPGAVPAYRRGSFTFRGDFTGNAFADMLLGMPYYATRVVGTGVETGRSRWQSYYFQDDWKVTRKLTLNIGLRYDYASPLRDIRDRRSVLYPLSNDYGTGLPGQIIVANSPEAHKLLGFDGVAARALYRPDRNDFGPRLGFAYSINPRTVVRGGYGMFYANTQNFINNLVINRRQPPYAETQERYSSTTKPEIDLVNPFASAVAQSVVATQNINPELRDGYVQQWNLVVQRELFSDLSVEAGYVGNKGTKLSELVYYNVPSPGPLATVQARRPFPNWGTALTMNSYVLSNYEALQAKVQKRFNKGLSLLASYTHSKSIDLSSERGAGDRAGIGGGDQRNLYGYFRGLSAFDVRNRLALSYVYELPFGRGRSFLKDLHPVADNLIGGWELTGITAFQGGFPFSVLMSSDMTGDGLAGDRPDVIGTPKIHSGNPNCYIEDGRNPMCGANAATAFAAVPAGAYRFGNAGRNILIGPGLTNWDLGMMKNFRLSERWKLQFRGEFFNLFNHANFDIPRRTFDLTQFGVIQSAGRAREMQFGLKLEF